MRAVLPQHDDQVFRLVVSGLQSLQYRVDGREVIVPLARLQGAPRDQHAVTDDGVLIIEIIRLALHEVGGAATVNDSIRSHVVSGVPLDLAGRGRRSGSGRDGGRCALAVDADLRRRVRPGLTVRGEREEASEYAEHRGSDLFYSSMNFLNCKVKIAISARRGCQGGVKLLCGNSDNQLSTRCDSTDLQLRRRIRSTNLTVVK